MLRAVSLDSLVRSVAKDSRALTVSQAKARTRNKTIPLDERLRLADTVIVLPTVMSFVMLLLHSKRVSKRREVNRLELYNPAAFCFENHRKTQTNLSQIN